MSTRVQVILDDRDELLAHAQGIGRQMAKRRRDIRSSRVRTLWRVASLAELKSRRFRTFIDQLNVLGCFHGLRMLTGWSKDWEYPFLYYNAILPSFRKGTRILDIGSSVSSFPWLLALLGARVHLLETDRRNERLWRTVKDDLELDVQWQFTNGERIPHESSTFDLVTSVSVIEHQEDRDLALLEIARVLKPDGLLAMSFDLCESDMGMSPSPDLGTPLSMKEAERLFGRFFECDDRDWKAHRIPAFHRWHRETTGLNYVTGAAILRKRPGESVGVARGRHDPDAGG
jgi:2-polyprenyl-3-methyl-5-hydroxy-6-metoxy-1,4-benzoquinol methylase